MPSWPGRRGSNPLTPSKAATQAIVSSTPLDDGPFPPRTPRIHSGPAVSTPEPSSGALSSPSWRRSHARSRSQPFPSLINSAKSDRQAGRETVDFSDEEISHQSWSASPHKQTRRGDFGEEMVSRRCMTCDHTNTFPRDRRNFRCGKCTTINDLKPCLEAMSLQVPPTNIELRLGRNLEQKAASPLTLERTHTLIESCVISYLQSYLDEIGPHSPSAPSPVPQNRAVSSGHRRSQSHNIGRFDNRTPSPILDFDTLAPSEVSSAGSRVPSTGNSRTSEESGITGARRLTAHQRNLRSDSLAVPSEPGSVSRSSQSALSSTGRCSASHCTSLFRPLEDYIMKSFDGCDTLNISFPTVRSHHPRAASEGNSEQRNGTLERHLGPFDDQLSQVNPETLHLGDVADNGAWWAGNRHSNRPDDGDERKNDFNTASGLVSSKTPRIDWTELAEWYQLIIHAGESWLDNWNKMKPTDSQRRKRWEAVEISKLEEEISASREHARAVLLKATEYLLQRPKRPLHRPGDIRFLLILLANPLLYPTEVFRRRQPEPYLTVRKDENSSRIGERGTKIKNPQHSSSKTPPRSGTVNSGTGNRRFLVVKRIIGQLSNLPTECHHLLVSWFSRLSEPHFRRLVELVGGFVTYRLTKEHKPRRGKPPYPGNNLDEYVPTFASPGATTPAQLHNALQRDKNSKSPIGEAISFDYSEDWQIRAAGRVMSLLFFANRAPHGGKPSSNSTQTHIVPINTFYNTFLDYSDVVGDFETWESRKRNFSFCQYPFFLSIYAKIQILEHDARRQMEEKARDAFFDSILGNKAVSQYLVFKVRRDCLVDDSLRNVSQVVSSQPEELKKGLRIEFTGEEGVDAGGLRKEWFLLLAREVFDPLHGLFLYDEDSRYCYFNPHSLEPSERFFLVGMVLGLAIYNSIILDIPLPPFAFRRLLAAAPSNNKVPSTSAPRRSFKCTLDDLAEYRPSLAKGLRDLLEYDGDVEKTFCRDFVIQMERYGELIDYPLCPGGENRPVTNYNRREFVNSYVKYLLNTSVQRQFEPFKRGFYTVCGGNALHLFCPEEIELLIRGSEESLDMFALRAVAIYDNWQTNDPEKVPVVNWFWDFFADSSPQNQRKILSFITGSDRIPAMGATSLTIRIVCLGGDTERFPTARTCFNMIALYRYKSRKKLEEKLWRAVVDSEGFGLK